MTAVCAPPDDYPQLIAQDTEASLILDKPRAGYAALILVARKASGNEVRLPLIYRTIAQFINFIDGCWAIHCFAGQIAENGFVFLYEHGKKQFEIQRGQRRITMSQNSAHQLVEALRTYVA